VPDNNTPTTNPHSAAASAYGNHSQKYTPDQRELEARVLLKAANMMQDLQTNWNADDAAKIDETLKFNRQIWMLFFDTALENQEGTRPDDLRSNIINLANFVFKRTLDIMAEPKRDKFDVLISINRDIAAGLMTKAGNDVAPSSGSGNSASSA
jgi:flagellar biosynthesis activator protein FlaF